MPQPTTYDRQSSFALHSSQYPTTPQSGTALDAEFNAVKTSLDETQANLALIQDDEGRLAAASVGREQLDSSITIGFESPTPWAAATEYTTVSTVFESSKFYTCLEDHTSGVFADDLAAGKWLEVADLSAAAALADGSVTTAKLDDEAVTAAKIGPLAVSNSKIATGAVTEGKIGAGAVTEEKIGAGAVVEAKIGALAVATAAIQALAVTTAKIAANAVTLAKLVAATAQGKILARKSSGSGDFEECSLSDILDMIGSATRGDILYRGDSAWQRLAKGTNGQFLKIGADDPVWANVQPGLEFISSQSASGSATLDFTSGLNDTYDAYVFELTDILAATDNVEFQLRIGTGAGPTYQTANYSYTMAGVYNVTPEAIMEASNGGASGVWLNPQAAGLTGSGLGNQASEGWNGTIRFSNPEVAKRFTCRGTFEYISQNGGHYSGILSGDHNTAAAVTGIRFLMSSGNIASGRIAMYGLRKA